MRGKAERPSTADSTMLRLASGQAFCGMRTRTAPALGSCDAACPVGVLCANAGAANRPMTILVAISRVDPPYLPAWTPLHTPAMPALANHLRRPFGCAQKEPSPS